MVILIFPFLSFFSLPLVPVLAETLTDLYRPSRIYEHCMENAWEISEQVECSERELAYQDEQLAYFYERDLSRISESYYRTAEERKAEFVAIQQAWQRARDTQMKFYSALGKGRWVADGLIWAVMFTAQRVEYLLQFFDLSTLPRQTQLARVR